MKIELNKDYIPPFIIFVIKKLKENGFEAFLVGGAVRDLILGIKPRDWDIATDASPQKIKAIFKKSTIIGKRFKLVQMDFGSGKVEISTFRKDPGEPPKGLKHRERLIWINKFFGTIEEDAKRRDFTINSLYWDPISFELIDYNGGLNDLKNKIIRTIGFPWERLLEDPVRIIRSCALSCKLDFKMDPELEKAVDLLKSELMIVPKPRLQEEILRILRSNFSFKILKFLEEKKILERIFPFRYEFSEEFEGALKIIDEINQKFSDDEIFIFLFFALYIEKAVDLRKYIDEESFLFRKGFLSDLNKYEVLLKKICLQKKIDKKYFNYKNFYNILRIAIKLCKIYPKFKQNVLRWKTFYFLYRKKIEEVK